MRRLARTSFGLLGMALIAPVVAQGQQTPSSNASGYQVAPGGYMVSPAPSAGPALGTLNGSPITVPAVEEAPHKHRGRGVCASCAAKQANIPPMPPGRIVACEHSKNGVCTACQAALNMPGEFVSSTGQPAMMSDDAPGKAVASSSPTPNASAYASRLRRPAADASLADGSADPMPVGVVQANFAQSSPMGSPAAYAPQMMPPGRAVAESNAGHDPYQKKSPSFPRPHIIGHLLGWSGIGAEKAEEKARRKAESHAMISYDENGTAPVNELPASTVFGKKR